MNLSSSSVLRRAICPLMFVACMLLAALLLAGCGDDGPANSLVAHGFNLQITAKTPSGNPASGLKVYVRGVIPKFEPGAWRLVDTTQPTTATTTIHFVIPISTTYKIWIEALDKRSVCEYSGSASVGFYSYEALFQPSDPSGVYRGILQATGTDNSQFADTVWMSVLRFNESLGYTDASGRFSTNDSIRFPSLFDLPELYSTAEDGPSLQGNYRYSDSACVVLLDTATKAVQRYYVPLSQSGARATLTWEPTAGTFVGAAVRGRANVEPAGSSRLPGDRGDIDYNGLAYEVADGVMLTQYYLSGLSAFGTHVRESIQASDANADGVPLSAGDLVYLIRVIIGDTIPYDAPASAAGTDVNFSHYRGIFSIDEAMSAGYITIAGEVEPTLLANNMAMIYRFDGTITRILIYPKFEQMQELQSFSGEFLRVTGEVVSVEFGTPNGRVASVRFLPNEFRLEQNFPNPFN